ncbi:hypothetical protein [Saccharicrinis aurantiacus]|uniref:hypothetical protein n=1 Tax=Saccharicrinis aurantiacus TaxID=1849719 RepID=UPI00249359AB|nr:hypothetical protein [Saccharicrinis aurantiacus]
MQHNIKFWLPLFFGFAFSSLFGISISNHLTIEGFWFLNIPIKMEEVAGTDSENAILKSGLLGYVFYLIFGVNILLYQIKHSGRKASVTMFLAILTYTMTIESRFLYNSYLGNYTGRHLYIAFPIFVYGLIIYLKAIKPKQVL